MTSQERFIRVKEILDDNNLAISPLYIKQFDKLYEAELFMDKNINEVIAKIEAYESTIDIDESKYPENIMRTVRQNLGFDELDVSHDDKIMSMPRKDVFNRYCEWNGLINGYGYNLLNVLEDIYGINLQ